MIEGRSAREEEQLTFGLEGRERAETAGGTKGLKEIIEGRGSRCEVVLTDTS